MTTLQTLRENKELPPESKQTYRTELCRYKKQACFGKSLFFFCLSYCLHCSLSSLLYPNYLGPNLPFIYLLRYKFRKGRAITENVPALLFLLFFLNMFTSGKPLQ